MEYHPSSCDAGQHRRGRAPPRTDHRQPYEWCLLSHRLIRRIMMDDACAQQSPSSASCVDEGTRPAAYAWPHVAAPAQEAMACRREHRASTTVKVTHEGQFRQEWRSVTAAPPPTSWLSMLCRGPTWWPCGRLCQSQHQLLVHVITAFDVSINLDHHLVMMPMW